MNEQEQAPAGYAGLVTRAIAIAIDLGIANLLAALTTAIVAEILSLLGLKGKIDVAGILAAGVGWFAWVALYFITFWTITGQTPGNRLIGIRVVTAANGDVKFRQAVPRFFAMLLCAIPLGLGFLPVLFDDRRRGYHDRIAGTVVRWEQLEDEPRPVAARRGREAQALDLSPADALPHPMPGSSPTDGLPPPAPDPAAARQA